jgi:hypothetical protein
MQPDFTNKYNTKLSASDEAQYQDWAKREGRKGDEYDYDMRGAWKEGAQQGNNGHFPDKFKKPNHPTFSTESIYDGKDGFKGGTWKGSGDTWSFKASSTNVQMRSPEELQRYFDKVEPTSKLILPSSELKPPAPNQGASLSLIGQ